MQKRLYFEPCYMQLQNDKYLASIIDDSVITYDEIIDTEAKSYNEETNFNGKKVACKILNFYILLAFLLVTIVLLIAVSIFCYLIKYQVKQKRLVAFHITNNELKQVTYQQYKLKMSNKIKI